MRARHRAGDQRDQAHALQKQNRNRASHRERRTATAGRLRVGIANRELCAGDIDDIVDSRAHQILQTERIDQQSHAVGGDRQIVFGLILIKLKTVLEPGTPATLNVRTELQFRIAFFSN